MIFRHLILDKCIIPVFDGLLPEPHNTTILRLLFNCAHWHGLAKLRMHIDPTLDILDALTIKIGADFRAFVNKTCPAFETYELNREMESRKRREAQKNKASGRQTTHQSTNVQNASKKERKRAVFNTQTYKYHSLGDYGPTIRRLGTTDSYSTEPVSFTYSTRSIVN